MSIRACRVIAVEGTHASGKTTLVHALVSYYKERGIHAACTGEPARSSPFMEEIVLHGKGTFDRIAELDLLGSLITTQLRAARNTDLLITDKTLINVLAYARLLLPAADGPLLDAMTQLCRVATDVYDVVFFTSDTFDPRQPGDRFREEVADDQQRVDHLVRRAASDTGLSMIEIPSGLSTTERVTWTSARLADLGVAPGLG